MMLSLSGSRLFHSPWLDRALILAFAFILRIPGYWLSVVIDWDESMYIVVAREILEGRLPYVSVFQEKPLGAPLIVAGAMAFTGPSILAVRILGSVAVCAIALCLREIALRVGLSRLAALVAAGVFAMLTQRLGGLATNTEILFMPFTAAAVWAGLVHLHAADARAQARAVALGGLLFGLAIWCKYISAFAAIAWFGLLVGWWFLSLRASLAQTLRLAALYAVLCWLPSILGAAYYWAIGHWDAFWYANIGFMSRYVGISRPQDELAIEVFRYFWVTRVLYIISIAALLRWRAHPLAVLVALVWLAAEAVAVIVPWKFWDHYFLLTLPPLCLLFATALQGLVERILPRPLFQRLARLPAALPGLAAVAVAGVMLATGQLAIIRPDGAREMANLINKDPDPGKTLWVINAHPIIYVLTNTRLPTPYAFPPHLITPYNILMPEDPMTELRRVLAARPRYMVMDPKQDRWTVPEMKSLIHATLARDYELIGTVRAIHDPFELYRLRR